ncbi:phage terminase large subunit family protein [Serratia marcescens]|uniref:phage terminase large subunit family protein n=1 Tax=Serratia marcescens TaxID=615 RepID=UPI0007453024|nr:phage terminase large subunit family protein [Serratia marcescens]MBH3229699.1 phage terminase large subunit family protein [Serratia marcescens]MBN5231112.1 phage terminase large subunit family protein [Serratia marcescens]MBN5438861.1 phage terminase large subunit family protein [Serratia marcescens]MDP8651921.1 phage terminase large subunit family protein [Serratia marcescens]MDP8666773.1 phage terminase large subunit family protein [Serratia marcescens]
MQITTEERTNAAAWQNFTGELRQRRSDVRPPEPLSLSEWANKYAVLSKETSAQTGRFRSFAYQDGMMDAITDPAVTQVSVMKSARVGYTKILDHVVGYYLAHDPSPILIVQPRVEDAEDYSKTEIAPMLRDTPVLAEICGDPKAKDSNQTILKKTFANGANLTLVGANSPGGFRRITCRIILFDEVDGYPSGGAGVEGDQIALGIKRSETFWNRKIALGSTPTVKGTSRIEKAYEESDQRRYYVPCPHCGEFQVLEWGGPETPYGIKWDKDENGEGIPESAYYVCRHNGCVIHHNEKSGMVKRGEWRATKPFKGHAGFHIWAGYSLFPNAAWKYLVAEWLRVKNDPLMRQTFINLVLGEPYEDRGEKALSEKRLLERCEVYAAEVPDGVAVLTAGIDTQDGRFEIEVTGWGRNEESWSIAFDVIEGDLETNEPWQRLDAYLKQVWRRADGRGFTIMAACMDSGGHHTQKVYEFAKERLGRRIWAIKGESARGGKRSPVWPTKKPTSKSKASFKPIIIGVNAAKDTIRGRLHIDPPAPGEPAASFMHFPADRDLNYFSQLLAERSVLKVSGGQRYRVWEQLPGRANEALDCRVYSYAALCGLFYLGLKLNLLADNIAINPDRLLPAPPQPEEKQNLRLPGVIIEEPEKPKRKRLSQLLPS